VVSTFTTDDTIALLSDLQHFFRGSQTSSGVTWGWSKSRNQDAQSFFEDRLQIAAQTAHELQNGCGLALSMDSITSLPPESEDRR